MSQPQSQFQSQSYDIEYYEGIPGEEPQLEFTSRIGIEARSASEAIETAAYTEWPVHDAQHDCAVALDPESSQQWERKYIAHPTQ